MKTKFATYDLCAVLHDLRDLQTMRVVNVYDINSKTYLIKLQKPNEKAFILFESGIRIHTTSYDWPKSTIPSGFSMKFRKHINQKRLTGVSQVGVDRVVDLQFGDEERSCHVIVELYDRGNVVLTDHSYTILNILRPRTDHDHDVRFAVRERYPLERARQSSQSDFQPSPETILLFLQSAKTGESLRKSLVRHVPYGGLLLDHAFTSLGVPLNAQVDVHVPANEAGASLIAQALQEAQRVASEINSKSHGGFIAFEEIARERKEEGESEASSTVIQSFKEYYPFDFVQFRTPEQKLRVLEFPTFSEAVDKFYSSIEAQRAEQRIVGAEKEAEKKLQNIRRDHENRIQALAEVQEIQERRGELVVLNRELVEQALLLMRVAVANMAWTDVEPWLKSVISSGNEKQKAVARAISKLQLDKNCFTLRLGNPYESDEEPLNVEINIGLSADQNARQFYDVRKAATVKQEKTAKASKIALKSAQRQASKKVSQVKTKHTNVIRARKTYWFEKFLWFISSDGFLVLAGRDAQQNELLVKRYMRPGDIYVHAEIQGAASVVVRNRHGHPPTEELPPKTLNEAGTFAVCHSSAWEANVAVNAWWVRHDQVSRTAPTGEFLTAGAFMIRGKRNFLPPCQLQLGFGLMFKLDDESAARHRLARKEELESQISSSGGGKEDLPAESGELDESVEEEREEEDLETKDEGESDDGEDEFPDVQVRVTGRESEQREEENGDEGDEDEGEAAEVEEGEEVEAGQDEALIDAINAHPTAEDQFLFALPVCAPYTAMQKFKFKVKVTPGTFKRGKAVKQALELFNRDKSLTLAERTLLKGLSGDDRLTALLPSKVRISAPAMNLVKKRK